MLCHWLGGGVNELAVFPLVKGEGLMEIVTIYWVVGVVNEPAEFPLVVGRV